MTIKTIEFEYEPGVWTLQFTVVEQTAPIRIKCFKSDFKDLPAATRHAIQMVESGRL
jgi:hypothetical protein